MRAKKAPKPQQALTVVENDWYKKNVHEFKDCIRCPNCNAQTVLTWEEYLEGAWKKRYFYCGDCGFVIDPYNQSGIK